MATTSSRSSRKQPTHQNLLDESLAQTFPASDPISPSPVTQQGDEVDSEREQRDWALHERTTPGAARSDGDSDEDSKPTPPAPLPNADADADADADAEGQIDRGPIPFPTQANHPPTREERVRAAAYRRFLERGSEHGDDLQDWLQAEAEIDGEDKPSSNG